MLEPAVSLAVRRDIRRRLVANRQRGRAPELARVFVTQVDGFTGPIGHRIVRPGRDLVVAAVFRPGVSAALDRSLEAEAAIGDNIDPGGGRRPPGAECRHVLTAIPRKSPESIEELELRRRRGPLLPRLGGR